MELLEYGILNNLFACFVWLHELKKCSLAIISLLEKFWKKYQYATKFVQLVKSKTPKVTLYTKHAKCMLMENSPNADLEVCFYDGE